mmetsp:Transcript_29634/g.42028  ORF Transcript_29634/g.42028 Transcript_29634/m.42028 type:complete len:159 (-) Transcript_29634:284-760(-)
MRQIRACTEGKGGHAAFASIMWSPPATMRPNAESQDFFKNLLHVKCDVLLIFGEQDPWCKPAFAKKMMRVLSHRPPSSVCRYVQLSNVGHCPNHEAPKAVAKAVSSWIAAGNQPRTAIPPLVKPDEEFREDWAVVYAREMKEQDIRVGLMDLLAVTFV